MTFDALFCTLSDLWEGSNVSAALMLSKLRIELGPLLRVGRGVEFGRCDDRVKAEIRGGNI